MSYPTRGTWVEIYIPICLKRNPSRTPHGVRELKCYPRFMILPLGGRTPHGVRELKLGRAMMYICSVLSYPTRGTWVEIILKISGYRNRHPVVPHTGYVSWNHFHPALLKPAIQSYPTRGTWVEINGDGRVGAIHDVVPHTGYVSWNNKLKFAFPINEVVPHTGYVSWNHSPLQQIC